MSFLSVLGKIGGGLKRGLTAGSEEPIFQHDLTREALLRLLIGGRKPGPAWQGPEMPPAIAFQRADEALMDKLRGGAPTPARPQPPPMPSGNQAALESLPPLDDDTLIARDL